MCIRKALGHTEHTPSHCLTVMIGTAGFCLCSACVFIFFVHIAGHCYSRTLESVKVCTCIYSCSDAKCPKQLLQLCNTTEEQALSICIICCITYVVLHPPLYYCFIYIQK